jgi:ribosomal protein L7/L12
MDDATLARRFAQIEEQLRVISDHLGIECPPFASTTSQALDAATLDAESSSSGLPPEVVELARAGHKTEAVSRLRHLTGATMLEAKSAVDAL